MKTILALLAASACLGLAAAPAVARSGGRQFNLKVGDRSVYKPDDLQCQILTKAEAVCASLKVANAVAVYYSPTEIEVVKVTSQRKGKLLFAVKR